VTGLGFEGVAAGPLTGVDLHLPAGAVGWLEGATASGKSLLLALAAGLVVPESGRVTIDGAPPEPGQVAMLFQNPDYQLLGGRVAADVALNAAGPEAVEAALAATGTEALRQADPATLTPGQRRRVALAGVLAARPAVALLDVPFAGQGRHEAVALWRAIRHQFTNQGTAVLVTGEPVDDTPGDHRWEVAHWHR
jgi:energy-coupling factor transporter ATP-binding protein EcfA2